MAKLYCSECGNEVEANDEPAFCPAHPKVTIDSAPDAAPGGNTMQKTRGTK